jgi:hypothetical protein
LALGDKASDPGMSKVRTSHFPPGALLSRYEKDGCHTDCYVTDIPVSVSHEQFVLAFYTTPLFKLERLILKLAASRPSTDEQAAVLASGQGENFAAWSVEDRCSNQILMCDFQGRTRSWLMTEDIENGDIPGTRLLFGSAVVPVRNNRTGEEGLGTIFRLLLGFHKLYSVALLSSAAAKLIRANR